MQTPISSAEPKQFASPSRVPAEATAVPFLESIYYLHSKIARHLKISEAKALAGTSKDFEQHKLYQDILICDLSNAKSPKQLIDYINKWPDLNSIESVNLPNNKRIVNNNVLTALANKFPGLQKLDLSGCKCVTDISALKGCQNLHTLNLSGCDCIIDVGALADCARLHTLNLTNCFLVTDISKLKGCQNLQILDLSYCSGVTDVSALAGCENLQMLYLSGNPHVNEDILAAIALNCKSLNVLSVSGCSSVNDIRALAGCTNLHTLDLSNCNGITDISALKRCTKLRKLDLSWCIRITKEMKKNLNNINS